MQRPWQRKKRAIGLDREREQGLGRGDGLVHGHRSHHPQGLLQCQPTRTRIPALETQIQTRPHLPPGLPLFSHRHHRLRRRRHVLLYVLLERRQRKRLPVRPCSGFAFLTMVMATNRPISTTVSCLMNCTLMSIRCQQLITGMILILG